MNSIDLPTSLVGADTYLQDIAYDSAGRTREQTYGMGVFTKQFNYDPWNVNGGRLQIMTAGTLQNMTYTYDTIGNILSITDTLAGPQLMQSGCQSGCQSGLSRLR